MTHLKIPARVLTIIFILFPLFLIISCENSINSFSENDNQTTASTQSSVRCVDVQGRFSSNGAIPGGVNSSSNISRSAFPLPGSEKNNVRYYAKATPQESGYQVVSGSVDGERRIYRIPGLALDVHWQVEVGMEVLVTDSEGNESWVRCLFDIAEPKKLTEDDCVINKVFILRPETTGTGSIDLDMTVDTLGTPGTDPQINSISVRLNDETQQTKWTTAFNADDNRELSKNKIKLAGLPGGTYELCISFYKSGLFYPCYTTVQTVHVINNLTTDTWQPDGTDVITDEGVFHLTSDIIDSYIDPYIYVGQTSAATSINVTKSNYNEGSAYTPLETVSEAINRINHAGVRQDYIIYVSGEISDRVNLALPEGRASSITIKGLKGLSNNTPQDIINGSGYDSALIINAPSTRVYIKDIQLTGSSGNNSCCLKISTGSQVTLNEGVLIGSSAANPTTRADTGIQNQGNLIIKGSRILGNRDGIVSYGDGSYLEITGGKISNNSRQGIRISEDTETPGKVNAKISGTEISYNGTYNSTEGGGIYLEEGSKSQLINCTIKNNNAIHGAGIYTYSDSLSLKNCLIENNRAKDGGGGIWVQETDELIISDTVIKNNISDGDNTDVSDDVRYGGALCVASDLISFKISGNIDIPYGVNGSQGLGKNDVDLSGGRTITVCGPLTCPNPPIKVTPAGDTFTRGRVVVQADNTNVTDLTPYKDFFTLEQEGWDLILSSDKKSIVLDAPIYVAGRSTKYICSAFGSDAASADGTSAAPFATIKKAIGLINSLENDTDPADYKDFTILIDGEILSTLNGSNPVGQDIGASDIGGEIKAHSLTIKGANDLDDNGNPKDIINGRVENVNRNARAITINTSVPITLECLKITGGLADAGGAISLDGYNGSVGNLTLSNDILITENKANETGGGLYIYTGSTLKVKGNVVIEGNTNTANPALPSNLYLQNGQKITVAGALTNGNKNARIGVSIVNDPDPSEPVQITNNYSTYSSGQEPDTYFFGDKWNIKKVGTTQAHEAYLAATGGGISIAPNYENITIGINQTIASASAATKEFTFTASAEDDEGNTVDVEIGNGEGKVSITDMMVTYHGETVPETVPGSNPVIRYYTKGTSSITFNSSLPAGHYTITLSAVYNGRNYSTGFEVDILEVVDAENLTADLYAAFTEVSVSSAAGMKKIAQLCSAGNTFANKTIKLEGNIILSSDFTAISDFKGTFDGQKHTISGLSDQTALFVKLENGTIKRLSVAGSTTRAGIVETIKNGTVEDCVSSVTITTTSGYNVGGIASTIASNSTGTIRNCVFKGEINTAAEGPSSVTGGILGEADTATCHIENCINKGTINCKVWTGGIIGYATGGNGSYIRNCKNTGNLIYHAEARGLGGIVGYVSSSSINIDNCCNTGVITGGQCTGIIACYGGNLIFNNNCNIGQAKYGILGPAHQTAQSISPVNNYSLSTVLSTGGAAWSTETEFGATVDLSAITSSMIASFGDTEDEVNAVVNALNRWVNANGASVYAGWIKNADGKPELNLGDLDKL